MPKPSQAELDLIQRFEAAYNSIDCELRKALDRENDRATPFYQVLRDYEGRYGTQDQVEYLRSIGGLRNILIHRKTEPWGYVAVPTHAMVNGLEDILKHLRNPPRAIPVFRRRVEVVAPDDSLAKVLRIISQRDYSQFPVYSGGVFKGLLTENGIARWLAHRVASRLPQIDFETVCVSAALKEEENRQNWAFLPARMTVDEVRVLFAERELLEAALLTKNGTADEELLGIATRWDILRTQKIVSVASG